MYRCPECGEIFEDPVYEEVCLEDYNGVGGMFPRASRHYATFASCPECGGAIHTDEDFYYEEDEEDDE